MAKWKTPLERKKCVICGKEFMPKESRHICCSDECGRIRKNQKSLAWQHEHKKPIKEFEFICLACGKTFVTNKPNQKTCNAECKSIYSKSIHSKSVKKEKVEIKEPKSNYEEIVDIAIEARKHGMSYGKYVAMMHMKGEQK